MKKNKIFKIVFYLLIIFIFIYLFYYLGKLVAPGHYPNAEIYSFNYTKNDLLKVIIDFKINNKKYNLPIEKTDEMSDIDSNNIFTFIRFYYPQENYIIYTAIAKNDLFDSKTDFLLIALDTSLIPQHGFYFNEDFPTKKMNNDEIKKFEKRILNPIKAMIKNKYVD